MTNRTMRLVYLLLAILVQTASWQQVAHAAEKPNIIFLFADDQNLQSVGCYGNPEVKTPQMDRLGRDGVIFDRHYNTTAICMASRASVFTGMYEYKTGTNFTHGNMKPQTWKKSYPVLLRQAGYLTAFAGKFGIVVEGKGLCEDDFDIWGGGPGQTYYATARNKSMAKYAERYPHSTLSYGAFAQDAIREAAKQKKPLCLSISFKAPHKPATPDPKFNHVYAGQKFTRPANFGREAGTHLSEQSKQGRQYPRFTEWKYDTHYDAEMAKYFQQVYAIDVALGMIRDELNAQGVAGNTVIFYTSDNGYICGAHGYGSKVLPMEESSRVPLIVYDPRSASAGKQRRCSSLTGNVDFAPTILELAGLPIPKNMDGVSLLPLLENPSGEVRERLALMNTFDKLPVHSLSVVSDGWKYTYWWYGDETMAPTEELFDLTTDPLEMTNLARDPNRLTMLRAMREKYDAELDAWKANAVPYNDYQKYGELFDRNVPWEKKNYRRIKPAGQSSKKTRTNAAKTRRRERAVQKSATKSK
ncbi:sulfatase family protein [Thalassoroseus pseudoceratinae]|uniref:sulfatase family protein n=1 Tax=Thalassoroseus pseudoceratinae TaxID=2713176 RepID=UPI00142166B7|nr:sulfatase [Thalassoroseus pseudoceratinae]